MNYYHQVLLPRGGHLLKVQTETLPINQIVGLMQKGKSNYWSAYKAKDPAFITLEKWSFQCVSCGSVFLPERQDASCCVQNPESKDFDENQAKMQADDIFESFSSWALQLCIPGFEKPSWPFLFHPTAIGRIEVTCPSCGVHKRITTEASMIDIYSNQHATLIKQQLSSKECVTIVGMHRKGHEWKYPLTRYVIFDHDAHRSILLLIDDKNEVIIAQDLIDDTPLMEQFKIDFFMRLMPKLRGALMKIFEQFYLEDFPFKSDELTLDLLILLNRFQSFPRCFYETILQLIEVNILKEEDLQRMALELAHYSNVSALYEKLNFPKTKALRRTVFENPGVMFFAQQLASLPFHNTDVLLRVIRSDDIYHLLYTMRSSTSVVELLEGVVQVKGEVRAWNAIRPIISLLPEIAWNVRTLPAEAQKDVLRGDLRGMVGAEWRSNYIRNYNFTLAHAEKFNYMTYTIDEYHFAAIKNSKDLCCAAKDLHNCLDTCIYTDRPVVGVKCGGKYVAAIELDNEGRKVYQAKLDYNAPIWKSERVNRAFEEWMKRCNIVDVSDDSVLPY